MDLPQEMLATSHAAEGTEQNANIDEASAVNRCNRKRRPKIHPIWKNFKEVRKPLGRILVCKTCAGELGIRSTTTVLKNHWNTKHKDEPLSSIETSILSQESNIRATNINKAFINVLAIPSISINSFLHSDMREFLSLLNPSFQVPKSHTTLRNMLVKECDQESTLRKKSWVLQCLHRIQNISQGTDPVKYWNANLSTEWHAIASFALDILSISGSGAPIEAVFSQAEIATTSRRNKTGSELLNAQLIISCNRDILGQIFYYY
ncbi:hypothetical protein DdX_21156 [Ditylenchus destructor]|uniref:HAT C-terminal dimerisation domain-containing protein n=1 Tax=Ditylenchus destructor TaxID=166010 RepID=A0AAD4MFF2_9BILA|nr:hypothetical protein DdX_21156 [Ditylenchus destructor]